MACTRTYPLSEHDAPHIVTLYAKPINEAKAVPLDALREQREWLADEKNGCEGRFLDGRYSWMEGPVTILGFRYRFTDANTAFWFKIRFG